MSDMGYGDAAGVVINSHQGISCLYKLEGFLERKNLFFEPAVRKVPGQELVTVPAALIEGNNALNIIGTFDLFYRNGN